MLEQRIQQQFHESAELKQQAAALMAGPVAQAVACIANAVSNGGKVLVCGNGGSAADAQHFAAELVGRFERERMELAAIALTTDTSVITALANDFGFNQVFSRQVRALGQPGDVLVAISTSGNSPSVLEAVRAAQDRDLLVVGLSGKGGGQLTAMLREQDVHLCVPHGRTARIQEVHLLMLHCICDGVDWTLMGDPEDSND
ncbi:MAG: phosphoheptose isomerase [Betaproteobacteria bacterium]|nr:phosphoheptose isomerase [Betaproteobacteria bacterium]MDE2124568.1 phosphoheptose isomerase [Betaproteobacteria bacterium]MDE2187546.1 phosphoheptose isomerase [Betaproteobacteria bacterium]MDE2324007.1 phosphoheptose isomerase [Betaproteobacteria bacterium]